ncbi:MAG: IS30 family transposase [Candidatus Peregrinibacteria bacterium]|nr:IS30 family transposase [Candidatus Peregrinibacteria bacterium]
MSHKQLSSKERIVLEKLFSSKLRQKEIAEILNRPESTISKELARNKGKNGKYSVKIAKKKLKKRRTKANQKFKKLCSKSSLKQYVIRKLKKYWSPQQIAAKLSQKGLKLCHETIYQFVYNERSDLKKYLRGKKGKYRRRHGTVDREKYREEAKKRRIDTRPKIVEKRARIGDWEGDTVRGGDKKSALLTHVDRKSGYLLANRLERALAEKVRTTTIAEFSKLSKKKLCTITYDNGSEFSEHETTGIWLKTAIYFAYPYHSWERGTNENTNGLLRQFFPKGTDFTKITDFDLQKVVKLINNRPRKRLNYHTPQEVFSGKVAIRSRI